MEDDVAARLERLESTEAISIAPLAAGRDTRPADARSACSAALRPSSGPVLAPRSHVISSLGHRLDDADHAGGVVYCRGEVQVKDRWIVQAIQYRDTYERRAGVWYFVRRKHLLWYGAELGESPIGLPPANWPEHHTGGGELPGEWDTWQEFWQPS